MEDQIKELMGLVTRYGNLNYKECDADYREHLTRSELYAKDKRDTYAAIESKLRAMLEKKPLSDEAIEDLAAYHGLDEFVVIPFARELEEAHGIGGE